MQVRTPLRGMLPQSGMLLPRGIDAPRTNVITTP